MIASEFTTYYEDLLVKVAHYRSGCTAIWKLYPEAVIKSFDYYVRDSIFRVEYEPANIDQIVFDGSEPTPYDDPGWTATANVERYANVGEYRLQLPDLEIGEWEPDGSMYFAVADKFCLWVLDTNQSKQILGDIKSILFSYMIKMKLLGFITEQGIKSPAEYVRYVNQLDDEYKKVKLFL